MEAIAEQFPTTDKDFPEVSIIMPCLNEADTLATCIGKARRALNEQQIAGEIIVADNGSTDGSQGYRDEVPRPPGERAKELFTRSTLYKPVVSLACIFMFPTSLGCAISGPLS
jgi:Glycosyl transferase family 2